MRRMLAVLRYEYKMQFRRLATWGIFLAATALSLLDNFPSRANLARPGIFAGTGLLCVPDHEPR